jgi:hypothetical protein
MALKEELTAKSLRGLVLTLPRFAPSVSGA